MENILALALFDLDNTLLNGDSDSSWGVYLSDIGVLDANLEKEKQNKYYDDYKNGVLDIYEYLEHQFSTLSKYPISQLTNWRKDFVNEIIMPMYITGKKELVEHHREKGDDLVIITATNDFVAKPIADLFNVDHLIASTAQIIDNKYTGMVEGTPSYAHGKVTKLNEWLVLNNKTMDESWFYSDSFNDLPLLEYCDHPVVVTPDDKLRKHALTFNWPIIN